MKILSIDHIVLNTANLEECLAFYKGLLGFRAERKDGRYALYFGTQKINIHTRPAEFLPAADYPLAGSLDTTWSARHDEERLPPGPGRQSCGTRLLPFINPDNCWLSPPPA